MKQNWKACSCSFCFRLLSNIKMANSFSFLCLLLLRKAREKVHIGLYPPCNFYFIEYVVIITGK